MAVNSIAKLAVVVTGDTSPLNQSMAQATASVKNFQAHAEGSHAALNALASGLKVSVQGMHAFEGSTRGIIHTLHNLASPGGAALVTAAAFVFLGAEALKAANKAAEARNKIREEFDKAYESLTGHNLGNGLELTINSEVKKLKEGIEEFIAAIAERTGLMDVFTASVKDLAEGFHLLGEAIKSPEQTARDRILEVMKARTEKMKEQKKEQDEWLKDFMDGFDRAGEHMRSQAEQMKNHAESLASSLRTPFERARDAIVEAFNFKQAGLISPDIFDRAVNKAASDYKDAITPRNIQSLPRFSGAFDKGTVAEYSARVQGNAEQSRKDELQKQAVQLEAKQVEALGRIETILKKGGSDVKLRIGRLD